MTPRACSVLLIVGVLAAMPFDRHAAATVYDGAWVAVEPPSRRVFWFGTYDQARHQFLIAGGPGECHVWRFTPGASPGWQVHQTTPGGPSIGYVYSGIFDPLRDRIVVNDGAGRTLALGMNSPSTWTVVAAGPQETSMPAVYDPVRDRMIVFGGYLGCPCPTPPGPQDGTQVFPLGGFGWTTITTSTKPPARDSHASIYDPIRDRVLIFGGRNKSYQPINDLWALSLSPATDWAPVNATGVPPPPGSNYAAAYDPVRDRMIVYGGSAATIWELSLSGTPAWLQLTPTSVLTEVQQNPVAIYDPVGDRLLLHGSCEREGGLRELGLSGASFLAEISPWGSVPHYRYAHSAVVDGARDRMIVFSGWTGGVEVWARGLGLTSSWNRITPAGTLPFTEVRHHSAILDPIRDRMIVFGGLVSGATNGLFALSLSGTPTWSTLAAAGTPPPARYDHAAIYDPIRDRMLVFGGTGGSALSDVWELTLSGTPTWQALTTAGTPPPGIGRARAVYDPAADRMVVPAGANVYTLDLAGTPTWQRFGPLSAPDYPNLVTPSAILDAARGRVVVYGEDSFLGEQAWDLVLQPSVSWVKLSIAGVTPGRRGYPSLVFDPGRDRAVIHAGSSFYEDTWILTRTSLTSVSTPSAAPAVLGLATPNPANGAVTIPFTVAARTPLNLTVHDLAGRRLATLVKGESESGTHRARWDSGADPRVRPGVYFVRMVVPGRVQTARVAILH